MNTSWLAIVLATVTLALPTPALALKVQQADQSELSRELLTDLSGLEEDAKLAKPEINALVNYTKRIQQLGGDPRGFLRMISVMPIPFDVETPLDFTPGQLALVKRKIRFQFGSGLLYHGMDDLDGTIQVGGLAGGMMLTRVANQWATGGFYRGSPSPAIVVVPTALFNRYLREGRATLKQLDHDIVEPYPTIDQPVPVAELVAGGGQLLGERRYL
ncbi:MAG: hypothetical protein HY600_04010 [Candidatus Omnitrophica bacterium]|nr:hypothetical protein [Candidatus Omnitrophota bacterium]